MREIGCRGQQPSYDREVEERHARSLRTTKGIIMTKLPKNYRAAAEKVGEVVSQHVIPRPHTDVEKILPKAL